VLFIEIEYQQHTFLDPYLTTYLTLGNMGALLYQLDEQLKTVDMIRKKCLRE
jgi:hypothetical protein